MIKIGETRQLTVIKKTDFGVYLGENMDEESGVLLPKNQVPDDTDVSDNLTVFIYKDSEDRLIATTSTPLIQIGQIKKLKVVETTKIGAFMDWGLVKDLLLPFKEQVGKVKEGNSYLVGLYVDKSERLCATMRIQNLLSYDHNYQANDQVEGIVYNVHEDLGVFVAVDDKYPGLLPEKEVTKPYKKGERVSLKVARVQKDGKMDLTTKVGGFDQMDADASALLEALKDNGGVLELTDKTDKDIINEELGMSKRAFKRAVGRLMKSGQLVQSDKDIRLK